MLKTRLLLTTFDIILFSVVFFFFFSFAYMTSSTAVMKLVVFFRSSKPPYNFWWSRVADGHCAIRSSCAPHLASWSANSLPGILQCAGIHWRTILHVLPSSCICIARRGDLFVWRTSNTDNASVRKTVGEHGSKEFLTKVAACPSASVSAL